MKYILLGIFFLIVLLLESTIWQVPLVLLFLLQVVVYSKTEWVFPLAIFCGIFVDSLSFRTVGSTSLFYLVFLFLVFLYEQKFELRTVAFVGFMSFLGSLFYFFIFGYSSLVVQVILSVAIGIGFFFVLAPLFPQEKQGTLKPWK